MLYPLSYEGVPADPSRSAGGALAVAVPGCEPCSASAGSRWFRVRPASTVTPR